LFGSPELGGILCEQQFLDNSARLKISLNFQVSRKARKTRHLMHSRRVGCAMSGNHLRGAWHGFDPGKFDDDLELDWRAYELRRSGPTD
jgi:hypothetical protein